MQRGNKVFALQDGDICLTSSTVHKTFQKYGRSSQCKSDGRGGKKANHVYVIGGIKGMTSLLFFSFIRIGEKLLNGEEEGATWNSDNFLSRQCDIMRQRSCSE